MAWGVLPAGLVVRPGRFFPGGTGGRGGTDGRHSPDVIPTTLGIPDYQDFRAQDLRHLVPTWETVTGYTPKQQPWGLHQGAMPGLGLGKGRWPEERMFEKCCFIHRKTKTKPKISCRA